jgi:hypothetical protein
MRLTAVIIQAVMLLAIPSTRVTAQTVESGQSIAANQAYLGGRVGGLQQSDLWSSKNGAGLGFGASLGMSVNPRWAVQIDIWIPRYATWSASESGSGEIRDRLVAISAVRRRTTGHVRPYLLVGAAVGKEDERSRTASYPDIRVHTSKVAWVELGGGALFPLSSRVVLAPELRVDTVLFANILRPSVALIYQLR